MPGDRLLKSLIWTYGKNYTIQFAHLGTLLDLKPLLRGLFSCPGHVSLGGGGCPSSALLLMCYGTKWQMVLWFISRGAVDWPTAVIECICLGWGVVALMRD